MTSLFSFLNLNGKRYLWRFTYVTLTAWVVGSVEEYVEQAIADLNDDMSEAMISVSLEYIGYQDLEEYGWYSSYEAGGSWCFPTYGTQNAILAVDQYIPDYDPDHYCNIYVMPKMCSSILGWSYVTVSENNSRDGIWLRSDIFGLGSTHPRNNENKVLTHEMGHYCGLHHVFQSVSNCGNGNDIPCHAYGDFVCDTPPLKFSGAATHLSALRLCITIRLTITWTIILTHAATTSPRVR